MAALAVVVTCLAVTRVSAAERDLHAGIAYLRAGVQARAEEALRKYRDEERDAESRRSVDRILPLLRQPLTQEMREYIAANLEERVRAAPKTRAVSGKPSYWFRMFPVFP